MLQPSDASHGQTFTTIGKVQLLRFRNSIRLRCRYLGKQYTITVSGLDALALKVALAKAQLIDADITLERFDTTLVKYDPKREVIEEKDRYIDMTLKYIWEKYKNTNHQRVQLTTQQNDWKAVDRALSKVKPESLLLVNHPQLVPELLASYSKGTINRHLQRL